MAPVSYKDMRLDFLQQNSPSKQPPIKGASNQWWRQLFKHTPPKEQPPQQFDPSAQNAIFYAQSEAKRRGAARVDTEHLLMGILREKDHRAARAFALLQVDRSALYAKLEGMCGPGTQHMAWSHDLAPRAKRALAYAFAEGRALNDRHLGAEHLLLGLVREGEGKAACALDLPGIDLDCVRQAVRMVKPGHFGDTLRRWWRATLSLAQ